MKEMTMDDVKAVSLDVLQEFHDFCEANGLRYSLGFGTLLGAIRHKGFIPWDDDVDVVMPRPDYERFFELYRNTSDFAAIDYHHGGALIAFGRLCDMKRTCVDSSVARWTEGETGVWIDIFPLDGSENNFEDLLKRMKVQKRKWTKGLSMRLALRSFSQCSSFAEKLRLLVKKIMFAGQSVDAIVESHIMECKRYGWDESKYVGHFSHLENRIKCLWPKEDFEAYVLGDFEGRQFEICAGYDRVLTQIYGDYMQLPPKEQQVPRHGFNKFFWK